LIFPFGVWFSAVYLGEHYIVDVIGGIVYATVAFVVAEKLIPYIHFKRTNGVNTEEPLKDAESVEK